MKTPIRLQNPPAGYKAEAFIVGHRVAIPGEWVFASDLQVYQTTGQLHHDRPIVELQPIEAPAPKIKAFEITEHKGYLGTWIDVRFEDFSDLMSRVDFRSFRFAGGETTWAQSWAYKDPDGYLWPCQSIMDDRTLVHASHVLREVGK